MDNIDTYILKDWLNAHYGTAAFKRPMYGYCSDIKQTKAFFDWAVSQCGKTVKDVASPSVPQISQVYFNETKGTTTVKWSDNTITTVTCADKDAFDLETGICICYTKKLLGNKSNFNTKIRKHVAKAINSTPIKKEKKNDKDRSN